MSWTDKDLDVVDAVSYTTPRTAHEIASIAGVDLKYAQKVLRRLDRLEYLQRRGRRYQYHNAT